MIAPFRCCIPQAPFNDAEADSDGEGFEGDEEDGRRSAYRIRRIESASFTPSSLSV